MAALTQAGLPPQLAEAVAELCAAFASERIAPQGDCHVVGQTAIDATLAAAVGA